MREKFEDRNLKGSISIKMDEFKGTWRADKAVVVAAIIQISEEYRRSRYTLTLRQLYYQLVSRDIIPNHDKVYKKISSIKDDVVYSGLVDWDTFEDRGRVPVNAYYEHSIPDSLQRTLDSYKLDRQLNQTTHIEVWTEKDAISGILKRVTLPFTIPLVINKGYNSSTAMYNAYSRFAGNIGDGERVCILYFGDHDPSGLDMVRDIRDRLLFMFSHGEQLTADNCPEVYDFWEDGDYTYYDLTSVAGYEDLPDRFQDEDEPSDKLMKDYEAAKVLFYIQQKDLFEVKHIGLTREQIDQYTPPPNPAKITDPRAKGYIEEHGEVSWEVDALNPQVMQDIVHNAILDELDYDVYTALLDKEKEDRDELAKIIDKFSE